MGRAWKSERIENILVSISCIWLGVEKLRNEKLFCFAREKSERVKKIIYINWLIYPYLKLKKERSKLSKKKKKSNQSKFIKTKIMPK